MRKRRETEKVVQYNRGNGKRIEEILRRKEEKPRGKDRRGDKEKTEKRRD